jgi:hypothetical protein
MSKHHDVFKSHVLKIARAVEKMPDAINNALGGISKDEARKMIADYKRACRHPKRYRTGAVPDRNEDCGID